MVDRDKDSSSLFYNEKESEKKKFYNFDSRFAFEG